MLEDAPMLHMPQRSLLYNLPMRGTCGATQESLLSYAQRVCAAHRVPVRRMLADVVLPAAGLSTLVTARARMNTVNPLNLLSLSGATDHAETFVLSMQVLTGRSGLIDGTLLRWRALFGKRIGMARERRWCPQCVANQSNETLTAFSLLWAIKGISCCPLHRTALLDRCCGCQKAQPLIGDGQTHGRCEHCGLRLGSDDHCASAATPTDRELSMASSLASMIGARGAVEDYATIVNFQERIQKASEVHFGDAKRRMTRELNLSISVRKSGGRISPSVFLDTAHRFGVNALDWLQGTAETAPRLGSASTPSARRVNTAPAARDAMGVLLHRLVSQHLQQPDRLISVTDLAKQLDISQNRLRNDFPEQTRSVMEHNARVRPLHQRRRAAELEALARQAMQDLLQQQGVITKRAISDAFARVGVHWTETEARAAACEELDKRSEQGLWAKPVKV